MKNRWRTITVMVSSLGILTALLVALPWTGQAAPPVSINSCTTISTPGHYELVADLTSFTTCIRITASHVHLKLNGHTITGPFAGVDGTQGIQVVGVTKVDIEGPGVITNFGRGIDFEGVDFSEVKGVTSTGNFHGIVVQRDFVTPNLDNLSEKNWFRGNTSTGNAHHGFTLNGTSENNFVNNTASNNGESGIFLFNGTGNQVKVNTTNGNGTGGIIAVGGGASTGHSITDNTAIGNNVGIRLENGSTGNSVKGNTAQSNSLDLRDDNTNCDNNVWMNNIFTSKNQACIE